MIEYLNFAVEDPRSQVPGEGFGRASLGGHIYRGDAINWLRGRFVQGDFAVGFLDGQILVANPTPSGHLWKVRPAFRFDPSDPVRSGFMKSVGQDADGDGDSDGSDFLIWQRTLGPVASGSTAVSTKAITSGRSSSTINTRIIGTLLRGGRVPP